MACATRCTALERSLGTCINPHWKPAKTSSVGSRKHALMSLGLELNTHHMAMALAIHNMLDEAGMQSIHIYLVLKEGLKHCKENFL